MKETQEKRVWSLSWEDSLEQEMETHCSILVLTIPWTEDPGGLQSIVSQRAIHDWVHTYAQPTQAFFAV